MVITWGEGEIRLKLDVQGQVDGKVLDLDRQGGFLWVGRGFVGGLGDFHRRHMCIIPNIIQHIKLVNIEFSLIIYDAYWMLLLTMKFFQVCEMRATPCYICVVDKGVNLGKVNSW